MKAGVSLFVGFSLLGLTGCASIVSGTNQMVSIETRHKTDSVSGAVCELKNPKGTYFVTTPGTVQVNRAFEDLVIKCEKKGFGPGLVTARSSTKAMAFGNIIFGGVIGAGVDIGTGAAYDYPPLITVLLGESLVVEPPKVSDTEPKK